MINFTTLVLVTQIKVLCIIFSSNLLLTDNTDFEYIKASETCRFITSNTHDLTYYTILR